MRRAPLPRYFFHTQTNARFTDAEGVDCATPLEARETAIKTCGELMHGSADRFWGSRPWTVTVTDLAGLVLWEIAVDGFASPSAIT